MSLSVDEIDLALKAKIVELLEEDSVMTVATVRPDGWPQATLVGYAHDDLTLYFVVARGSQKLANIARDPRVSIALGRLSLAIGYSHQDRILGLSMAARASEVTDPDAIERLNALVARQYPDRSMVFAPRDASTAVIQAIPTVISVIDLPMESGKPELVRVAHETVVHRVGPSDADGASV